MGKLTRTAIENFTLCKYKAYLTLAKGRYPQDIEKSGASTIETAPQSTYISCEVSENSDRPNVTVSLLAQGQNLILDAQYETESAFIHFDGLVKVDGKSAAGGFHYIPLSYAARNQRHGGRKLVLEMLAVILEEVQGRPPEKGVIRYNGRDSQITLARGLKQGRRSLQTLIDMQQSSSPPALLLNQHCNVCEFQDQCYAQAVAEDNLSLLRGLSEPEIVRLRAKGIFTITQYSYTFAPRRVSKRAKNPKQPRYFALQARAIREQRIFVHGTPTLSAEGCRVYMDFEGTPDDKSYYLIGLHIVHDGTANRVSFWADDKQHEIQIFSEMLDYLGAFETYTMLHYGAYEIRALRRMQRRLPPSYEEKVNEVIKRSINVLSVIGRHVYFPLYSNSLKDVARYLGYCWSAAKASGYQSLIWRQDWVENRNDGAKSELIRYNMRTVWLFNVSPNSSNSYPASKPFLLNITATAWNIPTR
jgi:predicted RecB family nuclease